MTYTFALWISNKYKNTRISKYTSLIANSEAEAYRTIIDDFYKYFIVDGDSLDKVVLISIKEIEEDDAE